MSDRKSSSVPAGRLLSEAEAKSELREVVELWMGAVEDRR